MADRNSSLQMRSGIVDNTARLASARHRRFILSVSVAALMLGGHSVLAATRTWNPTVSDSNFLTAANWGGTVPTAGDIANILVATSAGSPVLGGAASMAQVAINNNVLTVTAAGALTVTTSTSILSATGNLVNAGTISSAATTNAGSIVNSGLFISTTGNSGALTNLAAGTMNGVLTNTGTAANAGAINGAVINTANLNNAGVINGAVSNGGTFNQTAAGSIANSGGLTNAGSAFVAGSISGIIQNNVGVVTVTGALAGDNAFNNVAGATLNVSGGNYTGVTTLTNAGNVNVSAGRTLQATTAVNNAATGVIANAGTLTAPVTNSGIVTNAGQLNGTLTNNATGLVGNTGTLNGAISNAGTMITTGVTQGGLTNAGTVFAQGTVSGLVQNNAGVFTVTGALAGDNAFNNVAGATLNVSGGSYTGVTTLTNAGNVNVSAGQTLQATTAVNNAATGVIANAGTLTAPVTNSGIVTNAGQLNGTLTNNATGLVGNTGTINGAISNAGTLITTGVTQGGLTNAGTVFAQGTVSGLVQNNAGVFTVTGALAGDNAFNNVAGATLNVSGGNYTGVTTLTNAGNVNVSAGRTLQATTAVNNAATGVIANAGTLTAPVTNSGIVTNAGQLNGTLTNNATGLVGNTGTLNGAISNAGTLITTGVTQGGLTNAGTVFAQGTVSGLVQNNAGVFTVTGALAGDNAFNNVAGATLNVSGGNYTGVTTLTNAGNVNVSAGQTLQATTTVNNAVTGVIANAGTLTAPVTNSGIVTNAGQLNGTLTNNAGIFANNVGGSVTGTTTINGGTVTNSGGLSAVVNTAVGAFANVAGGTAGDVNNAGNATNAGTTGNFTNSGTAISAGTINGTLANTGTISVQGVVNGAISNSGAFTVSGSFDGSNGGFTNNAGTLFVNGQYARAGTVTNAVGATVINNALLVGTGVTNNGNFANSASGNVNTTLINNGTATNSGIVTDFINQAGGRFTNNVTGTVGPSATGSFTNSGIATNAGTINALSNAAGAFNNLGTLTGLTSVSGGNLTNAGNILSLSNGAGGTIFINPTGTVGATTNVGNVTNYGTVASLNNTFGTFANGNGSRINGAAVNSLGGSFINSGTAGTVENQVTGIFNNNTGAVAGALTNAGSATNAGTIASLSNSNGPFVNLTGGIVSGPASITGGSVTNTGTFDSVINQNAIFNNLAGGLTRAFTNSGIVTNSGQISSLTNTGGNFANNTGGVISGDTLITGGVVNNSGTLFNVTNQAGGTFNINNFSGTAGLVTNSGTGSNVGRILFLTNASGTFANNAGGRITNSATVTGGSMTNAGTIGAVVVQGGIVTNTGTIGSVNNQTGGTFANNGGGLVTGTTTITGGTVTNAGTFAGFTSISNGTLATTGLLGGGLLNGAVVNAAGTINGAIFNDTSASLNVTGNLLGNSSFANSGLLNVNTGNFTGLTTLTNANTINIAAGRILAAQTINNNNGSINVGAGATLQGTGNTFNNSATLNVGAGGIVTDTGNINNTGSGIINFNGPGGTATLASTVNQAIVNDGRINVLSGNVAVTGNLTNTAPGVLALTGGDFTGVNAFNNAGTVSSAGNRILGAATFNNQSTGLITMQNGSVTDNLTINGGYIATAGSRIAVDVDLSQNNNSQRGDKLTVTGAGSGATNISFNFVNAGRTFFSTPIDVLKVAPGSTLNVNQGLITSDKFFNYFLKESTPGSGVFQVASQFNSAPLMGVASGVNGVVGSLQAGFHQPASAIVSRPDSCAPNQLMGGPFIRLSSGKTNTDLGGSGSAVGANPPVSFSAQSKTDSRFSGFQAGADFGICNIQNTNWNLNFGLMGGLVTAKSTSNSVTPSPVVGAAAIATTTSSDVEVPFIGLYSFLTNGPFTFEVNLRKDYYTAKITTPDAIPGTFFVGPDTKLKGQGLSFNTSMSYRFNFAERWYIEPAVGLSKGSTKFGNLRLATSATDAMIFDTTDSLLGRIGINVGAAFAPTEKLIVVPFATASVWREMGESATAHAVVGAAGQSFDVRTERVGTFGQVGAGVQFKIVGTPLLGFVRGDVRFGQKIDGKAVNAGLRMQF